MQYEHTFLNLTFMLPTFGTSILEPDLQPRDTVVVPHCICKENLQSISELSYAPVHNIYGNENHIN